MARQVVRPVQPSALKRAGTTGLNVLTGGREWLWRQWSSLREESRDYLPALTEEFESSVDLKMMKLAALEGVEQTTRVTVEDAARCYWTEHWPVLFVNTFRGRRLLQAVVMLLGLTILIGALWIFPHPPSVISWTFVGFFIILFWPLVPTYAILQRLNALVRHRYLTLFISLQAFFSFIAVSVINHNRSVFEGRLRDLITTSFKSLFITHEQATADAHALVLIIQDYFWCVAILTTMMALWELIRRYGWWIIRAGKASYYDWPARQSAEVIIGILDIANFLHRILDAQIGDIETQDNETRSIWFRIIFDYRRSLRRRLSKLATTIMKPWRAAMWSYNGAAGRWLADQAPRIAFFIEYYQTKILLTGRGLIELRDAMDLTLQQAAEGNWQLIGAEIGSTKISTRIRWKNVLRRFLAILIAALIALAALLWKGLSPQIRLSVASTCSLFVLLQLTALIDPDAPGRVSTASDIMSKLHGSGS
jgi:hypothetical protein